MFKLTKMLTSKPTSRKAVYVGDFSPLLLTEFTRVNPAVAHPYVLTTNNELVICANQAQINQHFDIIQPNAYPCSYDVAAGLKQLTSIATLLYNYKANEEAALSTLNTDNISAPVIASRNKNAPCASPALPDVPPAKTGPFVRVEPNLTSLTALGNEMYNALQYVFPLSSPRVSISNNYVDKGTVHLVVEIRTMMINPNLKQSMPGGGIMAYARNGAYHTIRGQIRNKYAQRIAIGAKHTRNDFSFEVSDELVPERGCLLFRNPNWNIIYRINITVKAPLEIVRYSTGPISLSEKCALRLLTDTKMALSFNPDAI